MQIIKNKEFEGERPLYRSHDLRLENVTILRSSRCSGEQSSESCTCESAIKECRNIEADHCTFQGMYVLWEIPGIKLTDCYFAESARASLWYDRDVVVKDCVIDAPKCIRRMKNVTLENCQINNSEETLWDCDGVTLKNVTVKGGHNVFLHTDNIYIDGYRQDSKYAFQYSHNVEIHNAVLNTKDAFWEAENVTIYDSEINGEYLGWYAKNMRLVRCHITGTQCLCYVDGLTLEDCTFGPVCPDDPHQTTDLLFEYSTVNGNIKGDVVSIKNPTSGQLHVEGKVGEYIIDENQNAPADFKLI